MGFNFTILHFDGFDVIDTKTKSHIATDSIAILDYMEIDKELYNMRRKRRKRRK